MTADQLKAVGDAWAAASAEDIDIVITRINDRCTSRREAEAKFEAATVSCGIPCHTILGDAGVRNRLVAAGIVT